MLGAIGNCVVQIEARNRAGTPSSQLAVECDHDDRTVDTLNHPGRHNANHTGMPPVPGEDDTEVSLRIKVRLEIYQRLIQRPLVLVTSLTVRPIEYAGERSGFRLIVREKERQSIFRLSHPPHGVDARTDLIADAPGGDPVHRDVRDLQERP